MSKHKLLGIIDEDPYDPRTWSGSSAFFFGALKKRGALYSAISAKTSKLIQLFYKFLCFQPNLNKWRFKYYLNVGYYRQMTHAAKIALDRIDSTKYDTIVQIGAWYDMTKYRNKHVVSYHDGNLATLISSPYGYPRISHKYIQRTMAYEQKLYNRMDIIFPMSRWLADSFTRDFGVKSSKVFPVGAGINLPITVDAPNKTYKEPHILFVGKDFKRKGGEYLLHAFELVRKEIKDAELTIIGPQLRYVPKGVRCPGYLSKMSDEGLKMLLREYQRASMLVLPSLYEPFGIAIVEAMAHRLPCIGTDICAMPEIIQHGKTGYLVPPRDPLALANKILLLLKEPCRSRNFGDAGYQNYLEKYSWQAVATNICEVIENEL